MKVQALRDTFIGATYRKGPEFNAEGVEITPGDKFDVPDDFIVNRTVLRVIDPPASGKVRFAKLAEDEPPAPEIEEVAVKPPTGQKAGAGAAAAPNRA